MASRRRVVVTGMGVVAPNGNDVGAFWDALVNGRSGIGPIALFDAAEHKVKIAGQVKDFDLSSILEPKEARRTDRFVQFALYASMQATQDAGLDPAREDPERVGVIVGSGIGGIGTMEELFEIWTWSQLGRHKKPVGVLNVNGFYDKLLGFIDHMTEEGFLLDKHRAMLVRGETIEELLEKFEAFEHPGMIATLEAGQV